MYTRIDKEHGIEWNVCLCALWWSQSNAIYSQLPPSSSLPTRYFVMWILSRCFGLAFRHPMIICLPFMYFGNDMRKLKWKWATNDSFQRDHRIHIVGCMCEERFHTIQKHSFIHGIFLLLSPFFLYFARYDKSDWNMSEYVDHSRQFSIVTHICLASLEIQTIDTGKCNKLPRTKHVCPTFMSYRYFLTDFHLS